MKTREEIKEQAKDIRGSIPGIPNITQMLYLMLEVLLDIREAVVTNKS